MPPAYRPHRRAYLFISLSLALGCLLLLLGSVTLQRTVAAQTAQDAQTPQAMRPTGVILLLEAPAVAEVYAATRAAQVTGAPMTAADVAALTQAHLADVTAAQGVVIAALNDYDATLLYQVQRVYNGIAVYAPPQNLAALAELPGVVAVHPLIAKEPSNARAGALIGAHELWQGWHSPSVLTGQGVTIAIVDTGIDYLHTMFGGAGRGYDGNDTTVIDDIDGFPNAKVVGGYDFAGDDYNANPGSSSYQPIPQPDEDPMDCYSFGHGTHVAGTAAGYGVTDSGETYTGAYDEVLDLAQFRIAPGMAPRANLIALKVFGCTGSSEIVDLALEWALDPDGDGDLSDAVDIINLSLGSPYGAAFDATTLAAENAAKAGVLVVASAGNSGDLHYAVSSPGIAGGALSVGAVNTNIGGGLEIAATFSARGPRRGDSHLKPDLAAPGISIFSAARGTGNQGTSSSGTSMSAPVVAGGLALLRQLHPPASGWRNDELKALLMNSAHAPLEDASSTAYSLLRVGAGRLDLRAAAQSALIAYDAARPDQVSVSFGLVEVVDTATVVRQVRVANKSATAISVTVGYSSVVDLPGVTIEVDSGLVITAPAHGVVTLPVTLTVDAGAMLRRPDPTRQSVTPFTLAWLDEIGGYVRFTPASGPPIHVPVHAAPRPATELALGPAPHVGSALTATATLTAGGIGLMTEAPPTATTPIVSLFDLQWLSAPILTTPNDDPVRNRYALADLHAVGAFGPVAVDELGDVVTFGLATYGAWSTPQEVAFVIEIDTDGDEIADYLLSNRSSGYLSLGNVLADDFVAVLEPVAGGARRNQGPLNGLAATAYDVRPFQTNVMALPLQLRDLNLSAEATQFGYRIFSYSRDVSNVQMPELAVDRTPWLTVDWAAGPSVQWTVDDTPFTGPRAIAPDQRYELIYDREAFLARAGRSLLALHHHNTPQRRVQIIPLGIEDIVYDVYLPVIRLLTQPGMR